MPDREKVIDGLEKAKEVIEAWIPMFEQYNSPFTIDCAIELLQEQEAVRPVFDDSKPDVIGTFHCGACHSMLGFIHPHYCPHCGRKVKWE